MSNLKIRYGQQKYDFDEGILFLMSPKQVFWLETDNIQVVKQSGWMILIHPDCLWNTSLAENISSYQFWNYFVNEALFLSAKEELVMEGIVNNVRREYDANMDSFTKKIIISHIESLLNYADRYYQRQFITRELSNHQILIQVEKFLFNYFELENLSGNGVPSVKDLANGVNLSPNYLSSSLRLLTGLTAQQHMHENLIKKAKENLSATTHTVSEIAYRMGFEHVQSFSKLFKAKTGITPLEFRKQFN